VSDQRRLRRASRTRFRKVFDEGLALDQETARLHVLNTTAAFLLQQLAQPRSIAELVEALLREFDVEEADAERDVTSFLAEAVAAGLLEPTE
jgi:ABC-type uncharacterized transport system ATPase subunit